MILDRFWFWLRVFCCPKPINGKKTTTKYNFLYARASDLHRSLSKFQRRRAKKVRGFWQVSFALWKFLCPLPVEMWLEKIVQCPTFKSFTFFEPLLSVYITSGFECLWLTKESGKVTDGNREIPSTAGFKILLCCVILDWSNPWVVISWLEKPGTLWPHLVLQLLLSQGAPVCTLPRGYPGYSGMKGVYAMRGFFGGDF